MQDIGRQVDCLFQPLDELNSFDELTRALQEPGVCSAYGPDDAQRAHLLAAVARRLGRPVLVIEPNDMAAARMAEDMNLLLGGGARFLPGRDVTFLKTAASSRELSMRRIEALGDCVTGAAQVLVTPADAMLFRMAPPEEFSRRVIRLEEGMRLEPSELAAMLTGILYSLLLAVAAINFKADQTLVGTAMNLLGWNAGPLRGPLCEMEPANVEKLKKAMKNYGLL